MSNDFSQHKDVGMLHPRGFHLRRRVRRRREVEDPNYRPQRRAPQPVIDGCRREKPKGWSDNYR